MRNAPYPTSGKAHGLARGTAPRRVLLAAYAALIVAVLAGVAFVAAQSSVVPVVATVRHAPTLNGRVEGSVQMLTGEYLNLNSGVVVKGDLLVPGTPTVVRNGSPVYQGTIDGSGSASPSNYSVTLNSGSEVRYVKRRTDPIALAPVPVPPAPAGTRYVTINSPGQSVGTWATVRNLTLNSNVGSYAVPAGTYGNFTANSGTSFVLGTAGATQASVYNFEEMTLNSLANLGVVGPVIVNVANRVSVNSSCVVGSAANPQWLALNVSRYDVTINGGQVYGAVRAPSGTISLNNGTLKGSVASDRLNVNGGTIIAAASDTTPPTLSVTQPANNVVVSATTVSVSGTFTDESATTVTVNGVAATVSGNSFSATAALPEGSNVIQVVATDAAGNQTSVSANVVRDSTPPTLTIQQPAGALTKETQAAVTGTFSDATATNITVNGVVATITGGAYSATVPLSEGGNTLKVVAVDAAGNSAVAERSLALDTTPPELVIAQPTERTYTKGDQVTVSGSYSDATATSVIVNGVLATLNGGNFTANVPLNDGPNTLRVVATDALGNSSELAQTITRDTGLPVLTVTEPTEASTIGKNVVHVSGTVTDATPVTVFANAIPLAVGDNSSFDGFVSLPDGTSQLAIVATDAAGNQSRLTRALTVDSKPPRISDVQPTAGAVIAAATVSISGRVSDDTAVTINVNGVRAVTAPDSTFSAAEVPVSEGVNRFVISAADAVGHQATTVLTLVGQDRTPPPAPTLQPVISPTRLAFQTLEGRAEPGTQISIVGGAAPVSTEAAAGTGLFVTTVQLASGSNQLSVTAKDEAGNVSPAVQVAILSEPNLPPPSAGQAYQINVASGNAQRGLIGTELPRPLIAVVTDVAGHPVFGQAVRFTVTAGAGRFSDAAETALVPTDAQGHASVRYVAGPEATAQIVRADFTGNTSTPAVFSADALEATADAVTSVSGRVLDQNLRALPHVLVRLSGQQTYTGADGGFLLERVAAGPHQVLELLGRDQITLPGRWPNISYDFDVLPGIENNLGRPLFLPKVNDGVALPLDSASVVTADTTFELPTIGGEPPIRVTALAGTHVSFPPDVTDKRLSVTRIATNRTPMTLEEGRAASLYISVQPAGAIFDPPLRISFPNLDRLAPGTLVVLMSFDHDAGRYVQNGTGHVSADGRTVTGDAGSGIRVGAWHALPPDPPQPEVTVLGHIQVKDNPAFENKIILDAEAWVEGERAVLMSSGGDERLDFRATFSMPPGMGPKPAKMEATTNVADAGREPKVLKQESEESAGAGFAAASLQSQNQGQQFETGEVIRYAGSKDGLSDGITIFEPTEELPRGVTVSKYVWSVTGAGAENYTPPGPTEAKWEVPHVKFPPGVFTVKLRRYFRKNGRAAGSSIGTRDVEVGVRSDDLIALGYIDRDAVPISASGVSSLIWGHMPENGGPDGFLDTLRCNEYVAALTIGDLGFFRGANGMLPGLSLADRAYMLNWLFKYAGSKSPTALTGGDFQGPDGLTSEEKVNNFIANHTTSYKVLNRLRIRYRVSADGFSFKEDPVIEKSASVYGARTVGLTKNPCGAVLGFGDIFETQQGFADMKTVKDEENFGQISDGSPDALAINAFNTLTGKDLPSGQTPVFWEDVGSQIAFPVQFGERGKFILQPFPTFFMFRNGELIDVREQAARPIDHFYPNPYPFGTVPCGHFELTVPGGRCGDAKSPPAPGSRVPPFVKDLLQPRQ